ncbi:hypothetical protein PENTCL1PPCAC_8304, partial [Pristionchus entomophagus]
SLTSMYIMNICEQSTVVIVQLSIAEYSNRSVIDWGWGSWTDCRRAFHTTRRDCRSSAVSLSVVQLDADMGESDAGEHEQHALIQRQRLVTCIILLFLLFLLSLTARQLLSSRFAAETTREDRLPSSDSEAVDSSQHD